MTASFAPRPALTRPGPESAGRCSRRQSTRRHCPAVVAHSADAKSPAEAFHPSASTARADEIDAAADGGHRRADMRRAAAATAAALLVAASSASCPTGISAQAFGPVRITLDDLRVERVTCPPGTRAFGGYSQTRCLNIRATANSPSDKTLYNVDVFGRVYDAQGNNALDRDEASDAGRVTNIPKVGPGETEVQFPLRVSELQAQSGDLKLKNFKATGFPGQSFSPLLDECSEELGELQLGGECADPEDQVPF